VLLKRRRKPSFYQIGQKHRIKLFVRTVGLARAKVKIGMANLAYNFTRVAWLEARAVPV